MLDCRTAAAALRKHVGRSPPLPLPTVVRCFNVWSFDSETNSLFPPLSFKKKKKSHWTSQKIIPRCHWRGLGTLASQLQGTGISWHAACTLLRMTVRSAVCERLPLCVWGARRPLAFSRSGVSRPRPAHALFRARGSKSQSVSPAGKKLGTPT